MAQAFSGFQVSSWWRREPSWTPRRPPSCGATTLGEHPRIVESQRHWFWDHHFISFLYQSIHQCLSVKAVMSQSFRPVSCQSYIFWEIFNVMMPVFAWCCSGKTSVCTCSFTWSRHNSIQIWPDAFGQRQFLLDWPDFFEASSPCWLINFSHWQQCLNQSFQRITTPRSSKIQCLWIAIDATNQEILWLISYLLP